MHWKRFLIVLLVIAAAGVSGFAACVQAADKPAPVIYWMSAATENFTMPGMSGGMMGGMFGMPGGQGPKRNLLLQMNSPKPIPAAPEEIHDIPAGMNMGPSLPLEIPQYEKPQRYEHEYEQHQKQIEKDRMRMKIYWGCGEKVRPGQPRIIDTATMSPAQLGQAMRSRSFSGNTPPAPGRMKIYADWPNEKKRIEVPANASLVGQHFVHGNYSPDIRFSIDQAHDFLAPVEFSNVAGGLTDSISFSWRQIPNALGYFSMAMATADDGGKEMIIWSSSESYELGWQMIDYVPSQDVRRLVKEKVVLPSDRTNCSIPQGIFSGTRGAMLQFIAYGEDLYFAYPPKPKDPIWSVKVRSKSTGMQSLGMSYGGSDRGRSRQSYDTTEGNQPPPPPPPSGYDDRSHQQEPQERPAPPRGGGAVDAIRGLFGF